MGQDITNDDPLDRLDRQAEASGDVGKGDVDRAVERDDRRTEADQRNPQPLPCRHSRPSRHTGLRWRFRRDAWCRIHGANCGRGARSRCATQGKNFCQKPVIGQNVRTISPLRRRLDALLTLPEGGFDGDLTPKTAQKTPRQGSETTVEMWHFRGSNVAPGHRIPTAQSCAVAWPPDRPTVRRYKNQRTPRSCPDDGGVPARAGRSPRDGPPAAGSGSFWNASHVHVTPGCRNDGSAF